MTEPDRFRNLLAFCLVGAFVAVLPFLIFKDIPATSKDIVTYMVGQLSGMATMALGYYFTNKVGADALEAKKADNTAEAFRAITATAQASGTTGTDTLKEGDTVELNKKDPEV